jgi:phage shock protein E
MKTQLLLLAIALASATPAAAHEGGRGVVREKDPAPGIPEATVVDGEEAHQLVSDGAVRVLDVRTPEEFAEAHVPGAVNIPHDQIRARRAELGPATTPLMLYCKKGNRSLLAIDTLRELGFKKIYNLQRFSAWRAAEPVPPNEK